MTNARLLADFALPGGAEADQLHARALEHGEIDDIDFLTLRDLLELSAYDELPLQALLLVMFQALRQGSLCLRLSEKNLCRKFRDLTGEDQSELVSESLAGLRTGRWPALISVEDNEYVPLLRRMLGTSEYLYFQKTWSHARVLRMCLEQRLANAEVADVPTETYRPIVSAVLQSQETAGQPLNPDQQLGIAIALLRRFAIISGGPGTGKTSLVVALLRCLVELGLQADDICLAAPTGRAAHRMTESLQERLLDDGRDRGLRDVHGQTIHRLLAFNPRSGKFVHNEYNPLRIRMLVVDEVSMVDVNLMARLLRAVPADAHILLLGDKDQLPSVEAGAVLADLIPTRYSQSFSADFLHSLQDLLPGSKLPAPSKKSHALTDSIVILRQSYRSEQSILQLADAVNRQLPDAIELFREMPPSGSDEGMLPGNSASGPFFHGMSADDAEGLQALLDHWAGSMFLKPSVGTSSYLEMLRASRQIDFSALGELTPSTHGILDGLFSALRWGQILTFVRHGPVGVSGINRYLDHELRRVFDPDAHGPVFVGAPIMIQRNDRSRNLFNGDVGIILRGHDGNLRAVFQRLGSYIEYSVDSLPPYQQAFAVTIHKSQGSEYGRILLVLPDRAEHRLLSKEIIYTGLTRAKQWVLVVGRPSVFTTAVARRIERETGISVWGDPSAVGTDAYPMDDATGQLELFDY